MPLLNVNTSIVDYLKSQGQTSDFASRVRLFREKGYESRLGTYTGSATQNVAFLRGLQGETKPITPTTPASTALKTAGAPQPTLGTPEATRAFLGLTAPTIPRENFPSGIVAPFRSTAGAFLPTPEEELKKKEETKTEPPPDISATDSLAALGLPEVPSESALLTKAFEQPEFKLFGERQALAKTTAETEAEVAKTELERKFGESKAELEESLGKRGLFMSGIRTKGVQQLIESLGASKLEVDRKTATKLLEQNLDLRAKVIDAVADVVKEAQAGRREAIQQLNTAGFAVVGNKLVPTLAERKAQAGEERATRAELRAEAAAGRSEARLQLAQEAADRANQRLEIYLQQQQLGASAPERLRKQLQPVFSDASQIFVANVGQDGFVDPKLYLRLRAKFISTYPDKANLFDDTMAPQFLSQQSRTTLGIKKSLSPLDLELLE